MVVCLQAVVQAKIKGEAMPEGGASSTTQDAEPTKEPGTAAPGPSFALSTLKYPFVWRKGVLNGYSGTGVSLWDSLVFGRVLEYSNTLEHPPPAGSLDVSHESAPEEPEPQPAFEFGTSCSLLARSLAS